MIEAAERIGRFTHFEIALRARAWTGSPVRIDRRRDDWRAWTFSDGEEWTVRHAHAPRRPLRRTVVTGASPA
ncbi:MAG: hypothetical protein M3Q68_01955 [Actinomycetota bacterium]|nr:hypothetical protein [Actinomycetota bacterium]